MSLFIGLFLGLIVWSGVSAPAENLQDGIAVVAGIFAFYIAVIGIEILDELVKIRKAIQRKQS